MNDQPPARAADIPVLVPERPVAPRRSGALAWLAFLCAVSALGAAGWLWLDARQAVERIEQLEARPAEWAGAAAAEHALAQSQAALAATAARVDALERAQGELRGSLQSLVDAARSTDRALVEAEYLQRLAAQSLLMGRETRGALALLEASDQILRERDDPAFHAARALLAEDIAALRAVAGFDLEGLYLRLAALGSTVPSLAWSEPRLPGAQPAPSAAPAAAPQGLADRALALLSRYLTVRRDAPPVIPLLPLAEEQQLRMNIRLALEQAKLGLLAGEQQVYAGALADAGGLVRAHFGSDASANRAFLDEAARLGAERVSPPLPDLSDSLRALREAVRATGNGS